VGSYENPPVQVFFVYAHGGNAKEMMAMKENLAYSGGIEPWRLFRPHKFITNWATHPHFHK
jgi:hypothetical protein